MTREEIARLAWARLDEDAEDYEEKAELLAGYVNLAYYTAVRDFLHPREWIALTPDGTARAELPERAVRVIRAEDGAGHPADFLQTPDGKGVQFIGCPKERLAGARALCEVSLGALGAEDEPQLPEAAQDALADFVCWRMLIGGNLAMQRRAQVFLSQYASTLAKLPRSGDGSVKGFSGLYRETAG